MRRFRAAVSNEYKDRGSLHTYLVAGGCALVILACHLVPGGLTSLAFAAGLWIKVPDHPLSVIFISVWFLVCVQDKTGLEEQKQTFGPCNLTVRGDFAEYPHSCTSLCNALKARKLKKNVIIDRYSSIPIWFTYNYDIWYPTRNIFENNGDERSHSAMNNLHIKPC